MDQELKRILAKLAAERPPQLSTAEHEYLVRLTGVEEPAQPDPPRALWHWVRKQIFLFKGLFEPYFDGELDPILVDAGAPSEFLRGFGPEIRRAAPVSGEALKRAVRRHLGTDRTGTRTHAARLVGLLEMQEAAHALVDSLDSGREERADWGAPVIAASLEALARLRHPETRRLALKYVAHDDFMVRQCAQLAALLDEAPLTKAEFARITEAKYDARFYTLLSDRFLEGAKLGAFSETSLETLMAEIYLDVETSTAVADMVVSMNWRATFQKLLSHESQNLRAALALRVAFSPERWAIPYLSARLEEESDSEVKLVLIAAIGSLGRDEQPVARARLTSPDAMERVGAVWGMLEVKDAAPEIEALLKDERVEVRRAAGAALALLSPEIVDDHVELKWTELLNEDAWWPWAVPLKVVRAKAKNLPISAAAFVPVSNDGGRWTPAKLDRTLGLYRKYPHQLLRWLARDVPDQQRARAIALAGLVGGDMIRGALEQCLLAMEAWWLTVETGLEIAALGGSRSLAVETKTKLALEEAAKLSPAAVIPAIACALVGDTELRRRALRTLPDLGPEVEPYLLAALGAADIDVAQAAAEVMAQVREPSDPFLIDAVRLLSGEARKLAELPSAARLACAGAPKIRTAVAEAASATDQALLLQLAVDKDEGVAAAALGALAAHAGGASWVRKLVLDMTWSEHWRAKEKAVGAMAQIGDPMYLPRLVELMRGDNHGVAELAVRGLERIAGEHPELGLIVFDVREPHRVRDRYGLNDRVNYDADQHSEALRMILIGLDKKKDPGESTKARGRKVLLTPAGQESTLGHAPRIEAKKLEQIAMYLKVSYSDADSGTIIAEVSEEASGEVLSAILQNAQVAAVVAAWT